MSDLWWRITKMKKEAKSRAAKEHRRKYETAYESTPARKKYRRELERERRKRGVAGKGGKDMSHTKEGTIVPEDPHTNRARSHPSVGSTLKMVRIMKTEFAPPSEQGDDPAASTLFDPKTGKVGRSVVYGQPGMNPEEATRQVIHEDMHRATLPEVGIENMGHTEFPAMLGEELYLQRLAQEGKPHRKRDPHTLESSDPITEALYRTGKHSEVPKEQQQKYIRAYTKRKNPRVEKMVIVKAPLYDITTGKQVAGKPTPMPDLKDLKEPEYEYRFDYASNPYKGTPMTDLLYVSPDQSTRAKVMLPHNEFGGEPRATIPLMGVHKDKRGQGKGREALRNLKDELREVAPEVKKPPRPLGVGGMNAIRFWSQMDNEGLASYRLEDDVYDEDMERLYNDMVQQGEPMDIAMQLLKEQKKLFVQGQMTLDGRPAFTPTDFAAEERRRQAALKEAKAKEQRMIAVQQHEAMTNEERMARTEADRLKERQAREAQQRRAAMGNATLPLRNPE